jgi:hypothetical protein
MYRVQIDRQWYSTFDHPGVDVGDQVEFDAEQKGKFWNLLWTRPAGSTPAPAPAPDTAPTRAQAPAARTYQPTNGNGKSPQDQRQIARSVAFRGLCDLLATSDLSFAKRMAAIRKEFPFCVDLILHGHGQDQAPPVNMPDDPYRPEDEPPPPEDIPF